MPGPASGRGQEKKVQPCGSNTPAKMEVGRLPVTRRWLCCTGLAGPIPALKLRTRSRSKSTCRFASSQRRPRNVPDARVRRNRTTLEQVASVRDREAQRQEETRRQEVPGSLPRNPPVAPCRGRHHQPGNIVGILKGSSHEQETKAV